ncbi:MAG TPA: 50S ribosomal protein L31 [Thermotogota bacterium]|nr:50S ribosomal protein L31 [Thermotogota bacterium]HRW91656.1 50S ribosomal protein L31 [Thermotogota bacterium]
MKKEIHPEMHLVTARCACGAEYKVWSTGKEMKLDVCSACHPFYQGRGDSMIIDTEGRIDKFRKKYGDKY